MAPRHQIFWDREVRPGLNKALKRDDVPDAVKAAIRDALYFGRKRLTDAARGGCHHCGEGDHGTPCHWCGLKN